LQRQLKRGDKTRGGNTGYRRFLTTVGEGRFAIDVGLGQRIEIGDDGGP
jgi:hypothetical protein